jgi:formate hydrogenlyase transcriptional activator
LKGRAGDVAAHQAEKASIENALRESDGRIAGPRGAAVKLGIPRQTLDSRIRALDIDKLKFKRR